MVRLNLVVWGALRREDGRRSASHWRRVGLSTSIVNRSQQTTFMTHTRLPLNVIAFAHTFRAFHSLATYRIPWSDL
jgi:hypothetical protein